MNFFENTGTVPIDLWIFFENTGTVSIDFFYTGTVQYNAN